MNSLPALGLGWVALIVSTGTFWAFNHRAPDFAVFFEAWHWVALGQGSQIYHHSPDRFLYAPGFAWLLAPLGLLPKTGVLALWCIGKAAVIGWMIRAFSNAFPRMCRKESLAVAAWAFVLLARPFLIDFQYGQINTFILAASVWALLNHFRRDGVGWLDFLSWMVMAWVAVTKLLLLPLFLVPLFATHGVARDKLMRERAGVVFGTVTILILPFLGGGWTFVRQLYQDWWDALLARGFPLESHNQGFSAFMHHVFSGDPIHIIAWGAKRSLIFGGNRLSPLVIQYFSWSWTLGILGAFFFWFFSYSKKPPLVWLSVLLGILILPSHLVWKPYFLFGFPAAVLLMSRWRTHRMSLIILFFAVNFTGFDFLGSRWGALMEASAVLLWAHVFLLLQTARLKNDTLG